MIGSFKCVIECHLVADWFIQTCDWMAFSGWLVHSNVWL